jgi:hypothetical protein
VLKKTEKTASMATLLLASQVLRRRLASKIVLYTNLKRSPTVFTNVVNKKVVQCKQKTYLLISKN